MDKERKSFVFHKDWYDAISSLSQQDRCEVYDAIMQKVWGGKDNKLSPLAEMAMKFIAPQIERDTDKWLEIKSKRQASGKQGGLAKASKCYQMLPNATKCYQMVANDSKSKQNVANLPVSVDNISKDNVILENNKQNIDSKEKDSKEKEIQEFVDKIYAMYPSKCPVRNTYLGKSFKDKSRIRTLLKTYSMETIQHVVEKEIEQKYGKHPLKNFSTFLNNFPDPKEMDKSDKDFGNGMILQDNTTTKYDNQKIQDW